MLKYELFIIMDAIGGMKYHVLLKLYTVEESTIQDTGCMMRAPLSSCFKSRLLQSLRFCDGSCGSALPPATCHPWPASWAEHREQRGGWPSGAAFRMRHRQATEGQTGTRGSELALTPQPHPSLFVHPKCHSRLHY